MSDNRSAEIAESIVHTWRETLSVEVQRQLYGDSSYKLKDLIEEALKKENNDITKKTNDK